MMMLTGGNAIKIVESDLNITVFLVETLMMMVVVKMVIVENLDGGNVTWQVPRQQEKEVCNQIPREECVKVSTCSQSSSSSSPSFHFDFTLASI